MGFAYALPWQSAGGYGNILKAIVNDWQINGVFAAFSGTPFNITASGTSLNTPSNTQTADLAGSYNVTDKIGDDGRVVRHDRSSRSRPASASATRYAKPVLWTGRLQPGPLDVPHVPDGRPAAARVSVEAGNILNHAVYGNPNGNITSGTFGQITGINGNYPARQFRLGLRFTVLAGSSGTRSVWPRRLSRRGFFFRAD